MSVSEAVFAAMMRADGWDVTKRGWPDFICRRNGELMLVEVKGPHDGLNYYQYEAISDLRRAGFPTFVWNPDEGFTEVGPAVGESVFSLKATIAELRQIIATLQAPKVEPEPQLSKLVEWVFVEDDPETIAWMADDCRVGHPEHARRTTIGTSGSWCTDAFLLSRRFSPAIILEQTGMPNLGKLRRTLDVIRDRMFGWQHNRLHQGLPGGTHCTQCPISLDEVA